MIGCPTCDMQSDEAKKIAIMKAKMRADFKDWLSEQKMGLYQKRPVIIRAVQTKKELRISTPEGIITANIGDWIIEGVNGEFYPCKPDIFQKSYKKVKGDS